MCGDMWINNLKLIPPQQLSIITSFIKRALSSKGSKYPDHQNLSFN